MENVIYNELRMRGYSVDVGVVPIVERNQEGKAIRKQLEVDFVCNLGSSRYYIQSAYSLPDEAKRTQEIRPFRKIDDSFKKIVITKDIVQPYYSYLIRKFLNNHNVNAWCFYCSSMTFPVIADVL